jgi:hypothetical protein
MNALFLFGKYSYAALLMTAILGFHTAVGALTHPDPEKALLKSAYSGGEYLRYDIRWLNTIRAGVLQMEIILLDLEQERYLIKVTASSTGLLKFFYPIKDSFEMIVEGRDRLPVQMAQHDSRRGEHRLTVYNQDTLEVSYSRNGEPPEIYPVAGQVHNEFSSFLILRALPLVAGGELMVPTFADKARHEVTVSIGKSELRQGVLGEVATIKVQPRVPFQGLYEKMGDPLIWLTNDANRIPVRIEADIKIGSMTAELTEYRRL